MVQVRRSHEERREEIADTALLLIATRGLAQLTVASLAKELGITGGALYRHYPSTDAILEAVAVRAAAILDESLPDETLPPLVWLERFVSARSETVSGHAGLARLLLSEQVAMGMPEEALVHLRGAVQKTFAQIERAIRAGQESGEIRDDVKSTSLTPVVMGTVQMLALSRSGGLLQRIATPSGSWSALHTLLTPRKERSR